MNKQLLNIARVIGIIYYFYLFPSLAYAQQKHIYIACDDHTDYLWAGTEAEYRIAGLNEIDYYLNLADATKTAPAPFQSRFNLDCSWYVYNYQQNRTPIQFARLIDQIKSGHMSLPLNYFVSTYGGQSAETILRGMYYSGKLERQYGLDINLAVGMENTTQPLGLASLWAGSGAKYSWKGVCGCNTTVKESKLMKRPYEIAYYKGLDGSGVLNKWYSLSFGAALLGGYAEARDPSTAVNQCLAKINTPPYPHNIAGAFGAGYDDREWLTDAFPQVARNRSNSEVQVYVSNETDFFEHFESTYGANLPTEQVTYGNDWDVTCATLAPITAKIRNSVEKLRTAEALASVATLLKPNLYAPNDSTREQAWLALGSFWEHNFGLTGCCYESRNDWYLKLQQQVTGYVDSLYQTSLNTLANNIIKPANSTRFVVFNALSWQRTDIADIPYSGSLNIKVIDTQTKQEVPFQIILADGIQYLRLLAKDIPSVGYKVYDIQAGTSTGASNAATLNGSIFENQFYKLNVTSEGVITSLVDKVNGSQEFVQRTNNRYVNDFGQGNGQNGTLRLVNNGAISATIACTSPNPLQHTTYITLFKEINRIDIKNVINSTFGDSIRTYSFSFNLNNPTLWHEELGAILKAKYANHGGHYATPDNAVRHAWQTLNHFADIGSPTKGITISNEGAAFMKLGNSADTLLDENSAQVNVLIGGLMWDTGDPFISNQNGFREFTNAFSLRTRNQAFDAATAMRFALEHQNPVACSMITTAETADNNCQLLPADTFSMLKLSDPKVILWALKPSEEGVANGGLITRLWNLDTINHNSTVDFIAPITNALRTTHIETNIASANLSQANLIAEMGQQKMETFRVFLDTISAYRSDTTINATICANQQYLGYNRSGTYKDSFTSTTGCDSVRTLILNVLPNNDTTRITQYTCNSANVKTERQTLRTVNGCDSVVEIATRFIPFEYNIQKTDASCTPVSDGKITIITSNAYNYNWNNGQKGTTLSNLAAGTYFVTLTNPISGCTRIDSVKITAATSNIRVSLTGQDNYCGSGFVNAIVRGGIPPYTYQWNTNARTAIVVGVDAGNYKVTVTDSLGCQTMGEILINNFDSLVVTTTKKDASCFSATDGSVTVSAIGGVPPYRVSWSNGASGLVLENLTAGTYLMTLSDAQQCSISKSITIQSPSELFTNLQVQQPIQGDTLKGKAQVTPTGGQKPYRIDWSNGSTGTQVTKLDAGTYAVTVTDASGCKTTTTFSILSPTSSVGNIPQLESFKTYPNPTADQLNVELQFQQAVEGMLLLRDITGKTVYQVSFSGNFYQTKIPVNQLAKGIYSLQLGVGAASVEKLIAIQ